jgi:hypothetical protein
MKVIEAQNRQTREIALIDPNLPAWELLAAGIKKGIELIILDPVGDPLEQIAAALRDIAPIPKPFTSSVTVPPAPYTWAISALTVIISTATPAYSTAFINSPLTTLNFPSFSTAAISLPEKSGEPSSRNYTI